MGVDRRQVDLVVVDGEVPGGDDAGEVGLVLVPVAPAQLAGGGVEGLDDAGGTGDVEHAVVDQRVRLGPPLGRQGPRPREPQPVRVPGVDLVEGAVAPPVEGAPPVDPVGGVRLEQHRLGDRGERRLLRVGGQLVGGEGAGQHQRLGCGSHAFSSPLGAHSAPPRPVGTRGFRSRRGFVRVARLLVGHRPRRGRRHKRGCSSGHRFVAVEGTARPKPKPVGAHAGDLLLAAGFLHDRNAGRLSPPRRADRRRASGRGRRPVPRAAGRSRPRSGPAHTGSDRLPATPGRLSWVGRAHRTGQANAYPGRRLGPRVRAAEGGQPTGQ